ncbi:MAG: dipeptidyl-peptidase 3 family protein [Litorimonas sp.]
MKHWLLFASAAALVACSNANEAEVTDPVETTEMMETPPFYDVKGQYEKFAEIRMKPDTAFLTDSERAVVNKLMQIGPLLDDVFLLQRNAENDAIRRRVAATGDPAALAMFDLHFAHCDGLEDDAPFVDGLDTCPVGSGFYPADMTKDEFEAHLVANPDDRPAFTSGYTVIRRNAEGGLYAVPYSVEYSDYLDTVVRLMREAAALSEEPTLKRFLTLRADAFESDDYFESELAWMDLEGPIEIAVGPYEVYDDGLFGYKTAYEMFLTLKDPDASAALDKYKAFLPAMEANLPVADSYKNTSRGFESPIAVVDQIKGGGDNTNGVQTIAFNLPNDERVREAKGAKKVILSNVLGAKYDRILAPIGERVLVPEQAALTAKKWMSNNTLFHELSHSLGPGVIIVDGRETEVRLELKDLYSGIEEGKADVMGAYNILYMMDEGELDADDRNAFLATYFTGKFRSMRFGTGAAHAKGAAYQYRYFREVGAVEWLPEQERFRIDFDKLAQAISDLTGKVVMLQGDGDYDAAKAFMDRYASLDAEAEIVLSNLDDIPYDIRPIYPNGI